MEDDGVAPLSAVLNSKRNANYSKKKTQTHTMISPQILMKVAIPEILMMMMMKIFTMKLLKTRMMLMMSMLP